MKYCKLCNQQLAQSMLLSLARMGSEVFKFVQIENFLIFYNSYGKN